MASQGHERRKHTRIDASFLVSYRLAGSRESFDISQSANFSCGGLLLNATTCFEVGTRLEVRIQLPTVDEKIDLRGEVLETVRIVDGLIYRTRIRFVGMTPQEDALLKTHIAEYNTGA